MSDGDARNELTEFFAARFETLAAQLRDPLERGDRCFVVEALPRWLAPDLTLRLDVYPSGDEDESDETPRFAVMMVVDFGAYHRDMQLVTGDVDALRSFAADAGKNRALAEAILELMELERRYN